MRSLIFGRGLRCIFMIYWTTGEIREYDVRTKRYDIFVKGGILVTPQYLTFGRTDSATLTYGLESKDSDH